ncbi:MAG: DUF3179 domain-containing protein [Acidimicrobiaceae bacterium]|nr:DUF3179 domain-containing protein [Acidimicrobiaceae bacterium]MCY4175935.1 DUF3179 domain-containing protein [Acidimicrobiaceae bacterium]MCY4280825.1 DUF3179 domain-containing protein [Acidimicrobiaceae bacterium]MCY4293281.1 DUF3179 domain-containing protein [Acidimicrobiaceae bacterium]
MAFKMLSCGRAFLLRGGLVALAAVTVLGAAGCSGDDLDAPVTGSQTQQAPAAAEGGGSEPSVSGAVSAPGRSEDPEASDEQTAAADRDAPAASLADSEAPFFSADPIQSTMREDVPSALRERFHPDHPEPMIDPGEIRGVVPSDSIPSLEDPDFEPVAEVDWLAAVEPVLALEINGDARAYPLRIMTWHELVNGTVGGVPVTVSYCPLCNSAVAYDRRVDMRVLDFGTSGALLNSSLVMYDRQTESLWSHYTGQAVIGYLTSAQLDLIPVQTVSFERFLETYPDGHVLSRETGHSRRYGQNPYEYYDTNDRPFLFNGPSDDRLAPITRVLALRDGDDGVVISSDALTEQRVVPFSFAGRDLVALFEPGTASALDAPSIADGRDVGATGVFVRSVDGRMLNLAPADGGGFVDAASGVVYDILGRPTDSDGAEPLEGVEHLDTFWFAAAAFYPDAEIIGG